VARQAAQRANFFQFFIISNPYKMVMQGITLKPLHPATLLVKR
jgi:hypothetical protein